MTLCIIRDARQFRPQIVFLSGTQHMFTLLLLNCLGIKWVPVFHNTVWTKYRQPGRLWKLFKRLDDLGMRVGAYAVMCASKDIRDQLYDLGVSGRTPFVDFFPLFNRDLFSGFSKPGKIERRRVIFVGRITRDKGVFDLVDIAKQLRALGRNDISFDICGSGGDEEELK